MTTWLDKNSYWLCTAPQGTPVWHTSRGKRLTASRIGIALGHSRYQTPDELVNEMAGLAVRSHTAEAQARMDRGTQYESVAREWYTNKMGVVVKEVGLAIPKWDPRLGASVDGVVLLPDGTEDRGIIEIKCPATVYPSLLARAKIPGSIDNFDHIWPTYYDQMQLGMKVMNKSWCDYIVYGIDDGAGYIERVEYNDHYWNNVMAPGINIFFDKLTSLLSTTH